MINGIRTSLSALNAFEKKMEVTANNIANVNTDEFKKNVTYLSEGSHGGVEAKVDKVDPPGFPAEDMVEEDIIDVESSNVDLAEEFGETIITQNAYNANLKLVKTQDEILGQMLDILG